MPTKRRITLTLLVVLTAAGASSAWGQTAGESAINSPQATAVPRLVRFGGNIKDASGKPAIGVEGVTFALYKDQEGGPALWIETQTVHLDASGRYSIMLGATKPDGLPTDLFYTGEARWLGAQPSGQAEQPRVLLLSVPYALKAADAETVGGLPASAFVRIPTQQHDAGSAAQQTGSLASPPFVHGSGAKNYLPIWTGTSLLGNSTVFQSGANLGVGTTTPATTLDVNGNSTIRGNETITGTLNATGSVTAQNAAFTGNNTVSIISVTQNGTGIGLSATTAANSGSKGAINGTATATSGLGRGVIGISYSDSGSGVLGFAGSFGGAGSSTGVWGESSSASGIGVSGSGSIGVFGNGFKTGGLFQLTGTSGQILQGENSSGQIQFYVDVHGNLFSNGSVFTPGQVNAGLLFVSGFGRDTIVGDPGCGFGYAGIGFNNPSTCNNYAMIGSATDTFLNRPTTGALHFREGNGEEMTIAAGGNVGIGTSSPQAKLDVQGSIRIGGAGNGVVLSDGSQLGHLFSTRQDGVVLIGTSGTQVASLQVPAGNYAITAKTDITNQDGSDQFAQCQLSTGDSSIIGLAGGASATSSSSITLHDAATFGAPATITLTCNTFNGYTIFAVLQATNVASIN